MHTIGEINGVPFLATDSLRAEFALSAGDAGLSLNPLRPAPFRRLIRPAALFRVNDPAGVYTEINISMGRIAFEPREHAARHYHPFSPDPDRTLLAAFFGVEPSSGEDPTYFTQVCDWTLAVLGRDPPLWLRPLAANAHAPGMTCARTDTPEIAAASTHDTGLTNARTHEPGMFDAQFLRTRAERFARVHAHVHGWFHVVEMHLLDLMTRLACARRPAPAADPVESGPRAGRGSEAPASGPAGRGAATGASRATPHTPCTVEIGTYQGRSTSIIAAALADCGSDGLLLSIDPNALADHQSEAAAVNVASVGQRRRLVQFQRTAAHVAPLLADGVAGMAFIDGSHEFEDVVADFHICDRLLRPGGILAFHDIYPAAHLGYEPEVAGPTRALRNVVLPTGRYRPLAAAHLTLALQKTDG